MWSIKNRDLYKHSIDGCWRGDVTHKFLNTKFLGNDSVRNEKYRNNIFIFLFIYSFTSPLNSVYSSVRTGRMLYTVQHTRFAENKKCDIEVCKFEFSRLERDDCIFMVYFGLGGFQGLSCTVLYSVRIQSFFPLGSLLRNHSTISSIWLIK